MKKIIFASLLLAVLPFLSCNTIQKTWSNMNAFDVSEDIKLGKQVSDEIAANPSKYPLLAESGNEEVYGYIRNITKNILSTGRVAHRNDFAWQVKIINDDKTLNAFCTPGGYIYVYTGIIKYLDSEDQLAGVMGHEIAHAANRHSTQQMTKIYGMDILLQAALGKKNQMGQIAESLVGLSFSRDHERDADDNSVLYLCGTTYNSAGAAGFFKKIQSKGGTPPQFLSTHPNPANRVQAIEAKAKQMNCKGSNTNTAQYARIKSLLR